MIYLSNGNKKLKNTDEVEFLIFSLPAVITCPWSTELCRKSCYAKKAERIYPQVLPCRMNNLAETKKPTFVLEMIELIDAKLKRAEKKGKSILFRWHESGDIYNAEYLRKIYEICDYFRGRNITFQAYTKSVNLINYDHDMHNIHFTFSLWADTDTNDHIRSVNLGLQTYTASSAFEFETIPDANKCHCADCGKCQKCYNDSIKSITVKIH